MSENKKRWSLRHGLLEPYSPRTRAMVVGGAAGVTGAGLAASEMSRRRRSRKKSDMSKGMLEYEIVNPFEKAYRLDEGDASKVRVLQCVVPTGRHVGRANKLVRVSGRKGAGGKATRLERYTSR